VRTDENTKSEAPHMTVFPHAPWFLPERSVAAPSSLLNILLAQICTYNVVGGIT
jgi:hypothetical protein